TEPLGTGYEYSINGVDYQTSPVFEDVAPGTYMATAQHASVPGCVSDPQAVTINAAPTTYMPTVAQPDCNDPLGQITFPSDPDYEFAIYQTGDTPVFQTSSSFTDIPSGTYLAEMRLIAGGCNALPITLVVDEAPEVPAAPVSGGDQVVCALDPLQILTAEATVPGGATLSWYDAPIGGNVVAAPTLDTVGTITYYAEAGNGDCVSATRTALTLTIHPMPVIDADLLVDRTSCGPYTFPPITGTDFSNPVYRLELEGVEYFVLPGQVFQFGPSVDYGVYTLSIRALGNCGDYESSSFTL